MSLSVVSRGTASHNVSSSTFAIVPGSNFTALAKVLLYIAYDNAGGSGADGYGSGNVADTKGNTWTPVANGLADPGAANAGSAGRWFETNQNGGALTTGDTITVTFQTACVAKVGCLWEVASTLGTSFINRKSAAFETETVATPTISATNPINTNLVIAACSREYNATRTADADTTNGSWSAVQSVGIGTTTGGQELISQYKVVTADGTQTYNPTFGGQAADGLTSILVFSEVQTGAIEESITLSESTDGTASTPQAVTKFELWSGLTNSYVRDLVNNDIINLSEVGGSLIDVAIRARTTPDDAVGSVRLLFSGADANDRTENGAPYFAYGDIIGDPLNWTGPLGVYSLTATPYSAADLGGTAGTPLTIAFILAQTVTGAIEESLSLVETTDGGNLRTPRILDSLTGEDATDLTTRNITLPTCEAGDLIMLVITSDSGSGVGSISTPLFRGTAHDNGGVAGSTYVGNYCYVRYAKGDETAVTVLTASTKLRWSILRIEKGAQFQFNYRGGATTGVPNPTNWIGTNIAQPMTLVHAHGYRSGAQPTAPNAGWTAIEDEAPINSQFGTYVQVLEREFTAFESWDAGDLTAPSGAHDWYQVKFFFPPDDLYLTEPWGNDPAGRAAGASQGPVFTSTNGAVATGVMEKWSSSFKGNGHKIKRFKSTFNYRSGFSSNIDVRAVLYAHSGTFGTSSLPTGTALATSNTVNLASWPGIVIKGNAWFEFDTPYDSAVDEQLCMVLEFFNITSGHSILLNYCATSVDVGNSAQFDGTSWALTELADLGIIYEYELSADTGSTSETLSLSDTPAATNETSGAITEALSLLETPAATNLTGGASSEAISLSDTANATKQLTSGQSESLSLVDTPDAVKITTSAVSEALSLSDAPNSTKLTTSAVSEALSLSDTPNATKVTLVAITEAISLADSPDAVKVTSASISESMSLSETQDGTSGGTQSISEALALVDSIGASAILLAGPSETIVLAETVGSTKATTSAAQEAISLADSVNSTKVTTAAISESLALVDTLDAARTLVVAIVEVITLADVTDATLPGVSTISESINLVETPDATKTTLVAVTETLNAVDTVNAVLIRNADVTEAISLSDTINSVKATIVAIQESVALQDSTNSTKVTLASVLETISLLETVSAGKTTSASISEALSLSDQTNSIIQDVFTVEETLALSDSSDATVKKLYDNIYLKPRVFQGATTFKLIKLKITIEVKQGTITYKIQ